MVNQGKTHSKRGITKCPEPLALLLEDVNLLPESEAEMEAFVNYLMEMVERVETYLTKSPEKAEEHRKWYIRQIERSPHAGLSKALHEPFFSGAKVAFGAESLLEELDSWIRDRDMLSRIIEAYKEHEKLNAYISGNLKTGSGESAGWLFRVNSSTGKATDTVSFGFNSDTTLKPDGFRVLEILFR